MAIHTALEGLGTNATDLTNYTVWKSIADLDRREDGSSASGSSDWFYERMTCYQDRLLRVAHPTT